MKVSIIIPVYNVEEYIGECINSIVSQKDLECEVLLIDDGSSDKSGEICDSYAAKYPYIKSFHLKNGGPSRARNFGLEKATGEYIQFVDSDDELIPGYTKEFQQIAVNNYPDIILGGASIVDGNKKEIRSLSLDSVGKVSIEKAVLDMTIKEKELYLHYIWNKWYKKSFFTEHDIRFKEDVRLGEDFLLNCACFEVAKELYISEANMYFYFDRNRGSLTSAFRRNEMERRRLMDGTFLQMLKLHGAYDKMRGFYDAQIGAIAFESINSITLKKCTLPFKEKSIFIKEFAESEYGNYMEAYRQSENIPGWKKIILILINKKKYGIAAFLLTLKSRMR